jgi:hypothetical protein
LFTYSPARSDDSANRFLESANAWQFPKPKVKSVNTWQFQKPKVPENKGETQFPKPKVKRLDEGSVL